MSGRSDVLNLWGEVAASFLKVEVEVKYTRQSCVFIARQIAPAHSVGGHAVFSVIQEYSSNISFKTEGGFHRENRAEPDLMG